MAVPTDGALQKRDLTWVGAEDPCMNVGVACEHLPKSHRPPKPNPPSTIQEGHGPPCSVACVLLPDVLHVGLVQRRRLGDKSLIRTPF